MTDQIPPREQSTAYANKTLPGPVELIVFDWDGTLMDSTGAIVFAMRAAARDVGIEVPSVQRAAHVIGLGLRDALQLAVPDLTADQTPLFTERYRVHFHERANDLQEFDGISTMLNDLAGGPAALAIATGKSRAGLNSALQLTQWRQHFSTTRCADEGEPKPHPWMLNDICEELNVAQARTVMIGDTTHDLGMARAAGAHAIAVTYGAHDLEQLQSEVSLDTVHNVAQLHALLRNLLAGT